MNIVHKKSYKKAFKNLQRGQQEKIILAIEVFKGDPFAPLLNNHALKREMKGKRAISAGGDLRIIFTEKDDYVEVLMIDAGSHNQVYGE